MQILKRGRAQGLLLCHSCPQCSWQCQRRGNSESNTIHMMGRKYFVYPNVKKICFQQIFFCQHFQLKNLVYNQESGVLCSSLELVQTPQNSLLGALSDSIASTGQMPCMEGCIPTLFKASAMERGRGSFFTPIPSFSPATSFAARSPDHLSLTFTASVNRGGSNEHLGSHRTKVLPLQDGRCIYKI